MGWFSKLVDTAVKVVAPYAKPILRAAKKYVVKVGGWLAEKLGKDTEKTQRRAEIVVDGIETLAKKAGKFIVKTLDTPIEDFLKKRREEWEKEIGELLELIFQTIEEIKTGEFSVEAPPIEVSPPFVTQEKEQEKDIDKQEIENDMEIN